MVASLREYRPGMVGVNWSAGVKFLAVAILLTITAAQAASGQTLTDLHAFLGFEGATPTAGVTMDGVGDLYGTTQYGGTFGYGSVFKLVHRGSAWILNPLYDFPSYQSGNDGAEPYAGVTIGPGRKYLWHHHVWRRQRVLWHGIQTLAAGVGVPQQPLPLDRNHSVPLQRRHRRRIPLLPGDI